MDINHRNPSLYLYKFVWFLIEYYDNIVILFIIALGRNNMKNISKEQIESIFIKSTQNNLLNLQKQIIETLEQFPEHQENPLAYAIIASTIAQSNVMLAMKEILNELLVEN